MLVYNIMYTYTWLFTVTFTHNIDRKNVARCPLCWLQPKSYRYEDNNMLYELPNITHVLRYIEELIDVHSFLWITRIRIIDYFVIDILLNDFLNYDSLQKIFLFDYPIFNS